MDCDICFERQGNKCLHCNFNMCKLCLKKWNYNECPQCKKENSFIHECDLALINMLDQEWVVSVKRSELNDDYIETIELSYNWNTKQNDLIEKNYYSPFVRNCWGKIVGSTIGDPVRVNIVMEYKRCFLFKN